MTCRWDLRKQKIRGWKRRVKQVERWKTYNMNLNMELFKESDREYVKQWGCPFYSLRQYTLPNWYKRLLVQALIEIYDSWRQMLAELEEPLFLKIWVFENNFIESQVVVSYREFLHFYDDTFSEIRNADSLPEELTTKDADSLLWSQGLFLTRRSENELLQDVEDGLYTLEEVQAIKESVYSIERSSNDTFYIMNNGVVWIGGSS